MSAQPRRSIVATNPRFLDKLITVAVSTQALAESPDAAVAVNGCHGSNSSPLTISCALNLLRLNQHPKYRGPKDAPQDNPQYDTSRRA
jgi:hypothetical protein